MPEIVSDAGVGRVARQSFSRVDRAHVCDKNVVGFASLAVGEAVAGAAFRVARVQVCRDRHVAERDDITVVQNLVDRNGREAEFAAVAEVGVAFAAILKDGSVRCGGPHFGAGTALDLSQGRGVVEVCLGGQENPDIFQSITQGIDIPADIGQGVFEPRVDQYVTITGRDEEARQVFAAYRVQVSDHTVGRKTCRPAFGPGCTLRQAVFSGCCGRGC